MAESVDRPFNRQDAQFNLLEGWTWVGCYGGYYLQSDLLADFEHGFFTRQWQGRGPEVLAGYVSAGLSVHHPKQVHSDAGGQSLWVCGADCTPVLIADPVSGRVAACHAGWRGVAGGILLRAIEQLEQVGCQRQGLLLALGPAVSGVRYQVELSVAEQVAASLPAAPSLEALEACGAVMSDPEAGRCRLDIRAATRLQLEQAGIPPEQISVCPLCTVSEELLFHSWRRDQVKAVQWSGIVSQQLPV
jgi:polyphenol oxidase